MNFTLVRTEKNTAKAKVFIAQWDGDTFYPITKPMAYHDAQYLLRYMCQRPDRDRSIHREEIGKLWKAYKRKDS